MNLIARVWHGWTTSANATAYQAFLEERLFPSMSAKIAGFRGGHVLQREDGDEVKFLVLTLFESLEDIRNFAGDNYETAVIEPDARALLNRWEQRASHYQTGSL
jgi:heme-degrading monooxygenase HmoA